MDFWYCEETETASVSIMVVFLLTQNHYYQEGKLWFKSFHLLFGKRKLKKMRWNSIIGSSTLCWINVNPEYQKLSFQLSILVFSQEKWTASPQILHLRLLNLAAGKEMRHYGKGRGGGKDTVC